MKVDKNYCMNSFLQFRFVFEDKVFKENLIPNYVKPTQKYEIENCDDLDKAIKDYVKNNVDDKTALMLSGGIDSAILASYIPKGTKAFTLKCIADEPTTDETIRAKQIADINGLDHEIVEIRWSDYEKYIPILLEHKKAPFHSIEVQIYKAALRAKELGYNKLLFGESADSIFGGLDGLLSKDWSFDEFVKRFNFTPTEKILKKYKLILEPYKDCINEKGKIDAHKFISTKFFVESTNSYFNACNCAEVKFLSPYSNMKLISPLDVERVRKGDSKYLVRELFKKIYFDLEITKKTPMPRPMGLWLKSWKGPRRYEFIKNCQQSLNGDQKWLVFILEKFLNYFNVE